MEDENFLFGKETVYTERCEENKEASGVHLGVNTHPLLTRVFFTTKSLGKDPEKVSTPFGDVEIYLCGSEICKSKPVLLTFHDIGLNAISNFSAFFDRPEMEDLNKMFTIIHINAPGQNLDEKNLPSDYHYPNMESLSEIVEYVCHYYGISDFVGFGVGLGANVFVRLAQRRPKFVNGLILINCDISAASWAEWAYQKIIFKSLKNNLTMPDNVIEHLLWYHLGPESCSKNLISIFKHYFKTQVNKQNISQLLKSFASRTEIKLSRDLAANGKTLKGACRTLKVPVLNMVGHNSPHISATVTFNGKMDPKLCTWMKIQDSGMIIEEQPTKVVEAMKLFLQGLGYNLKKSSMMF